MNSSKWRFSQAVQTYTQGIDDEWEIVRYDVDTRLGLFHLHSCFHSNWKCFAVEQLFHWVFEPLRVVDESARKFLKFDACSVE